MNKSPQNGSTTAQYIIILALVCVVCIPAFFILGKNLFDYFSSFKSGIQNGNISSVTYVGEKSKSSGNKSSEAPNIISKEKGSLGGTPAKPKKECVDGVCFLDYGEFVLKDVPSDLSEHLKVSGSSGVTDYMSQLLDKITDQADNSELLENEINLIMTLSNICHQIAILEAQLESNAYNLVQKYNQYGFFMAESDADMYYQQKMNELSTLKTQMADVITQIKSDEIREKIEKTGFAGDFDVVLNLGDIVASRVNSFNTLASQIDGGINSDNQLNTLNELLSFSASFKTEGDSKKICLQADGTFGDIGCK